MLTPEQQRKKRLYIRGVIAFCLCLIPLIAWMQRHLLLEKMDLPIGSTVLVFALININALLLLLMIYLVLRNLVELVFERRHGIPGSSLRTRLVVSFVCLSLVPTALLFFIALRFISTSMDYWFNTDVEKSLRASLELARTMLRDMENQSLTLGAHIAGMVAATRLHEQNQEAMARVFGELMDFYPAGGPDALGLYRADRDLSFTRAGPRLDGEELPEVPSEVLRAVWQENQARVLTQDCEAGELVRSVVAVPQRDPDALPVALVTTMLVPARRFALMRAVSQGMEDYRQLITLKAPIEANLWSTLLIITLLIIFGAIWFGFYVARGITGPIDKLAKGIARVAGGDLDFVLDKESDDELGMLVESFNTMTRDLAESNRKLADFHEALTRSNLISEQRRQYMEIVLANVAAGVISVNEDNEITTFNHFAEKLLGLDAARLLGRDYREVLAPEQLKMLHEMLATLDQEGGGSVERSLRISVGGRAFSLLVNVTRLHDHEGSPLGFVIVFDDLTKIEKMQRMAAWREVARRIAHEIKNPLTPIQLSAQRLRKRFAGRIPDDTGVFDRCTATIIGQVEEIRRLVSEFSNFARMPRVEKRMGDLAALAEETLVLYREAHRQIRFTLTGAGSIPEFPFDPVQMRRALINLLDNAVAALATCQVQGRIGISLAAHPRRRTVFMEVRDNGPGISEQDKRRLFEPYFSTKKSGTGLGLAITAAIVADHGGYIRVRDVEGGGAAFIIELPLEEG